MTTYQDSKEIKEASTKEVVWEMLLIGVPACLAYVSQMLVEIINLAFIGHLGNATLVAATGLGNMWIDVCGLCVLVGLNSGVATFVS